MKVQEASKDITKGGIMFPSPKTSYMEANTQKDDETCIYMQENTPGRPKHDPCFLIMAMRPKFGLGAPSVGNPGQNCLLLLLSGKT